MALGEIVDTNAPPSVYLGIENGFTVKSTVANLTDKTQFYSIQINLLDENYNPLTGLGSFGDYAISGGENYEILANTYIPDNYTGTSGYFQIELLSYYSDDPPGHVKEDTKLLRFDVISGGNGNDPPPPPGSGLLFDGQIIASPDPASGGGTVDVTVSVAATDAIRDGKITIEIENNGIKEQFAEFRRGDVKEFTFSFPNLDISTAGDGDLKITANAYVNNGLSHTRTRLLNIDAPPPPPPQNEGNVVLIGGGFNQPGGYNTGDRLRLSTVFRNDGAPDNCRVEIFILNPSTGEILIQREYTYFLQTGETGDPPALFYLIPASYSGTEIEGLVKVSHEVDAQGGDVLLFDAGDGSIGIA